MTALSTDYGIMRTTQPGPTICRQPRAGVTFRPGALVVQRAGSNLAEVPLSASPRADLIVLGRYVGLEKLVVPSDADAYGGALNSDGTAYPPITFAPGEEAVGPFDTGSGANAISDRDIDTIVFAYDDNTLYKTNLNGQLSPAGYVHSVQNGKVFLRIDPKVYAFGEAGPLATAGGAAAAFTAKAVITSLAANTAADGVMIADADGAIGTQDGVTLAVGDCVIIPEGTTNLDAAADAGPYEVVSLGSVSAPFELRRPAWWADGATMPRLAIEIEAGGTLYGGSAWKSFSAASAVVGTDAPALYPDYVAQQVTLVAGTKDITNVPVLSASKAVVSMSLNGGTPAGTTTNYQTADITAGVLGTASITVQAESVAGTIVNTDVAVLNVGIRNW